MMNKYDISLFLLKHKRSKVRDSRLRSVAQALLTGSDEEKFARPEKDFPNLPLLSKVWFNCQVEWIMDLAILTEKCRQDQV